MQLQLGFDTLTWDLRPTRCDRVPANTCLLLLLTTEQLSLCRPLPCALPWLHTRQGQGLPELPAVSSAMLAGSLTTLWDKRVAPNTQGLRCKGTMTYL